MHPKTTAAATLEFCPECGVSLAGLSARKEAIRHYGATPPNADLYPLARSRYDILMEAGF